MNTELMFSSKSNEWNTPDELFDALDNVYNFTLDACASKSNTKCEYYYTAENSCLTKSWNNEIVFMNPPYGKAEEPCKRDKYGNYNCKKKRCIERGFHIDKRIPGIGDFVKKAYEECRDHNATVVCLLPARTCTPWFQDYCLKYGKIEFIRGRLKFSGIKNSAPFPSIIVVFNNVANSDIMSGKVKTICSVCGHPITSTYQIGASINGDFCDYDNRESGDISMTVCGECWAKINEILKWDFKDAQERY